MQALIINGEAEVRLMDTEGYAILVRGSAAYCTVEYKGNIFRLYMHDNLYDAICKAGAKVGSVYLISRNAQAAKYVYKVKLITRRKKNAEDQPTQCRN